MLYNGSISQGQWSKAIDSGLGDFVRRIHGDRIDDSYEGNCDAVAVIDQLSAVQKLFLKTSDVARSAVMAAYMTSPRNSQGAQVIVDAVRMQYAAKEVVERLLPSVTPDVMALLVEKLKKTGVEV